MLSTKAYIHTASAFILNLFEYFSPAVVVDDKVHNTTKSKYRYQDKQRTLLKLEIAYPATHLSMNTAPCRELETIVC